MKRKKYFIFLVSLLLLTAFQYVVLDSSNTEVRVHFLDVGQGDAILISYPTGERMLIDTGKDSKLFRELDKVLPWYEKTIEYVLLSHGDLDHVGAMIDLLGRYKIKTLFVHEFFGEIEVERQILDAVHAHGASVHVLAKGDTITLGSAVSSNFEILHPGPDCMIVHKTSNECSLVALMTYGSDTFLFTGDIGKSVEKIVADLIDGSVTVLKVGHHGSKNSSGSDFVQDIAPRYSIIQSGTNSYGHPHPDAISNLTAASSTIYNTKEDATIVASSDGNGEIVVGPLFDQSSFFKSGICAILLYSFDASC